MPRYAKSPRDLFLFLTLDLAKVGIIAGAICALSSQLQNIVSSICALIQMEAPTFITPLVWFMRIGALVWAGLTTHRLIKATEEAAFE